MSYPLGSISLQQADRMVVDLNEVMASSEYYNGDGITKVLLSLRVLGRFGVGAVTSVKTSQFSSLSTNVLKYLQIHIGGYDDLLDEMLADWYAQYQVGNDDTVAFLVRVLGYQGCQ